MRKYAKKYKIYDAPGHRKIHQHIIPRAGGIAIFLSFLLALLVIQKIYHLNYDHDVVTILWGGTGIVLLGALDDIFNLKAPVKLLCEIIIVTFVVHGGVNIDFINNPITGKPIFLGPISELISIGWILVLMNTINLIDGLDGLASGVVAISAFSLFLISLLLKQPYAAPLLIALVGSTLGFLRYNFNPASIFMGDAGSLFLGYILAVASIHGVLKSSLAISLAIPILSLLIPITDTFLAIRRRIKKKRHIFRADNEHIHHKLLGKGLSHRDAVLVLYYTALLLNILAIILTCATGWYSVLVIILIFLIVVRGFNAFRKYIY